MSTLGLLGLTAAITAVGQRKGLELVVIGAQAGAYNEGGWVGGWVRLARA